jgi:hypothetical protein
MIVAGLSGLSFSEGFAKLPNHDGTWLRFARDSLLEGTGFEPSVPPYETCLTRPTRVSARGRNGSERVAR